MGLALAIPPGRTHGPDRPLHPHQTRGLPVFKELAKEDDVIKAPVSSLFKDHWRQLIQAVGAVLLNAVGFYVILSYMPTYLSQELGMDETASYVATTVALLTYIGFIFLTGMLSDRLGRKRY